MINGHRRLNYCVGLHNYAIRLMNHRIDAFSRDNIRINPANISLTPPPPHP